MPTSRKRGEKWGTHFFTLLGPPYCTVNFTVVSGTGVGWAAVVA